ncbi:MAG: hypothetical protein R3D86_09045 [Emcibacteraceae bacterium]
MWEGFRYYWEHKRNSLIDCTAYRLGFSSSKIKIISKNALIYCIIPFVAPLLTVQNSIAQETLNIPSYYGGTSTNSQTVQDNSLQNDQQTAIQNYQNLINNIQINQNLLSQLSESSQVVANPNTGEVRTVGTNDPTPSGWMRLDVTPTTNGYVLGSNSASGQFSYTIQSQPVTTNVTQAQSPTYSYSPNMVTASGGQTTVTNNTQTTVGDTTTQSLADGTKITSTPTETVDTEVTTITTPDSKTVITETTTTTVTENLIQSPTIVTSSETGGGMNYATQAQQATQATQAQQTTSGTSTGTNNTGTNTAIAVPTVTGGQTTVTNDTQTTVGDTTTQILDNGTKITSTPTQTVDTTVTTTTTPNSKTTITETLTTTTTEGTIETPAVVSGGNSTSTTTTPSNTTLSSSVPDVDKTPTTSSAVPIPNSTTSGSTVGDTGSKKTIVDSGSNIATNQAPAADDTSASTNETDGEETATTDNSEVNMADASKTASTENGADDTVTDDETSEKTDEGQSSPASTPAAVKSNQVASASGMSQAEREAAAARAAEEERRRREEYIRQQQEASSLRQGAQARATALIEDNNNSMMGVSMGQMGGSEGMMDPQRMSIFTQNARLKAGNTIPNLSPQIASLSNSVASASKNINDGEAVGDVFGPCPEILANACEEAANKVADELDKEINDAKNEGEKKAKEDLDDIEKDLDEDADRADEEKKRRDKRSARQKAIDALEEEQRQRAEDLNEQGDELEERGNEQQERRARLEQEERDLRKAEQEARRNGDPNCRSSECRSIREQRQQNSRNITDLAREEGRFQADQARFQGQVQDFQRNQARLDAMRQGDPVFETERMRNEAHQAAANAQSEVDRLREEQLNLRRQGGSGSRQDQAYDRAIEQAEREAQAAANNAQIADSLALKAQFYANGMQDEWNDYENARKAADAFNNYIDANNQATDLRARTSSAQDALDAARQNPDFDPKSLSDLENEVRDLRTQLETAEEAVRNFAGDVGNTTKALTGKSLPVTNATSRQISEALDNISGEFAERQRLSNLTDAELNNEINMINEAKTRVTAARNGLGGTVEDPGGQYTDRYKALQAEQQQLQENIENFNPMGSSGTGVVFGADQAYRDMTKRLSEVESELNGLKSIGAASDAVDLVNTHNQWAADLTDGLPLNADGTINRTAFAKQVGEMAQAQVNLVNATSNLQQAQSNLAEAQAGGDPATIERAQSRVSQYNEVVDRITGQFAENDINISTNSEGGFALSANSIGASSTWAAAAEGVSNAVTNAQNQQQQLANSPQQAKTTNNSTDSTTERIVEVASDPVLISEPPLEQPGGFFQYITDAANDLSEQATHGAAIAVASATKPTPTIADQHELISTTKQAAREVRSDALRIENQIDTARFDAEQAQKEAEFQRSQADQNVGTRERQADEYVGFADYAEEQASKNRAKAEDLEAQAERLRQSAAQFNAIADSTDDKSLARDARAAAQDNLQNAREREEQAKDYRTEASRDDARAAELTARETEIREDAQNLETKAQNAEADAARAQAEVERLESEAARLNSEAAKLDQLATTQANSLVDAQRKAFNELINSPPEGWRWSSLSSDERSEWLQENIPQWSELSIDQRIDFIQKLELGEAANDFKEQNSRYEEFNNSSQGQRSTKEMLESRQRDLVNMQTRLKELNDMTIWNDEEEAEANRLKEGLEVGTSRLRADQRARNTEEMLRYEAWQEANKKLWAVNDEKRAEEVQRNVDAYADAQSQVGNARNIQSARSQAFDTREAEIQNRINNPTSAEDAEVAKGELTRLQEARKYWEDFDARTVAGSEAIAADVRREITYYGTMNGLGEIAFEDNLEERTNAKLMSDSDLNSQRQATATTIQNAVNGIDFKEADPTIWESIITGYDATTDAVQNTAVGISSGVGALYGVGKGTVKSLVGLADILIVQSLDTYYETLQLYFNEATGLNVDIFGSENLDTINNLGEASWGDLGMKFVIGEGKKISDGLDQLNSAYQTGSLSDAFSGSSEITAVGAELFVDPAMVIGGGGKIITVLRGLDKVDELAQAANILEEAARGANAINDAARTGSAVATDVTRGAEIVGDTVRFTESAHLPEVTGGAYKGLDELLGPEFANAFGEVPKAPVYPPARPTPLRPGTTGPTTVLPPRDGPYIGLDELLGPEFAGALDGPVPATTLASDTLPYQGLDELLGPEFANAFGTTPRAPVYPPVRPTPLRPGTAAPAAPLPPRDGPFQGLDELLGPEFANAFDDVPNIPKDATGVPYQGLDEILGPEFANAFGEVPKAPVYPPARPTPLRPGTTSPTTVLPPREGPYIGLDEMLGPEFRNAFDEPFPAASRTGPGGTQPVAGGNGGQIPPTNAGAASPPASSSGIPPTNAPGARPAPSAANSNAPLAVGESGIPVNEIGIPPTNPPVGIPPTNAPGARPVPSAANTNLPLRPGESGLPLDLGNAGPNGTLFDGPVAGPVDNIPGAAPSGTSAGNLPPGVFRTENGLMQVPLTTAPTVRATRAGRFLILEDTATGSRQVLEVGDEVGRGSFTVVNDLNGKNQGNVIKLSREVDPVTARLDNVGTQAFTDLPKQVKDNFVYTPEARGEFQVTAANDNGVLAGRNIRIAEKAPVPTYSQARGARTPMTLDEVESISRAQDLINEGGFVVLDLKSNNFGFQDLPNGFKRTIVHDAGGTVPTVGATSAERAANAKTIQRALMTPDESLVTQYREAMNAYESYKLDWARARANGNADAAAAAATNMQNAAERAFDITSGHGRAVLEEYGHLIDEASLGVPLEEIGFNPVLGFNQDGVRAAARSAVANDNFTGFGNAAGGF